MDASHPRKILLIVWAGAVLLCGLAFWATAGARQAGDFLPAGPLGARILIGLAVAIVTLGVAQLALRVVRGRRPRRQSGRVWFYWVLFQLACMAGICFLAAMAGLAFLAGAAFAPHAWQALLLLLVGSGMSFLLAGLIYDTAGLVRALR